MQKKYEYNIGDIYGVKRINSIYKNKNGRLSGEIECIKCKKITHSYLDSLHNKRNQSCSCLLNNHGLTGSKLYSVYHNMKYRCYNSNCIEYKNYGGKGVSICDEWLGEDGFSNFYDWAYKNGYSHGLTIDRIDNNGNYEPSNCQWISLSENTIKANKTSQHRKADKGTYWGKSPNGDYYEFDNANEFAKNHKLNGANIRDVANDRKHTHYGWTFGFVGEKI